MEGENGRTEKSCTFYSSHSSCTFIDHRHFNNTLSSGCEALTSPTFCDFHALVELGEEVRVLGPRAVCLGLGVVVCEDWWRARGRRRWGVRAGGAGGRGEQRRRSNGTLREGENDRLEVMLWLFPDQGTQIHTITYKTQSFCRAGDHSSITISTSGTAQHFILIFIAGETTVDRVKQDQNPHSLDTFSCWAISCMK